MLYSYYPVRCAADRLGSRQGTANLGSLSVTFWSGDRTCRFRGLRKKRLAVRAYRHRMTRISRMSPSRSTALHS